MSVALFFYATMFLSPTTFLYLDDIEFNDDKRYENVLNRQYHYPLAIHKTMKLCVSNIELNKQL